MAGMAAGIRLRLGEKRTLILERHEAAGGLNSFYRLGGYRYDVGLHAMTNYVGPKQRRAPLSKLFRQLRIPREAFDLSEQEGSRIQFPGVSLRFTNDFEVLCEEVAQVFPKSVDGFRKLADFVRTFDATRLTGEAVSARERVQEYIGDPLLLDMLMCPICFYGSARENDIDLGQFCIMFQALFFEGFARPYGGVRQIISALTRKYASLGGERRMRMGVQSIETRGCKAVGLILDSGERITADEILSSAGWLETRRLYGRKDSGKEESGIGKLSFVETINVMKVQPRDLGWKDTIVFFNTTDRFDYARPKMEAVDPRSGVICLPNNYQYPDGKMLSEGWLRVTSIAHYERWKALERSSYLAEKDRWFDILTRQAVELLRTSGGAAVDLEAQTLARDMFTPTTITRYTGHLGGAIYGSPQKQKNGRTELENVRIIGTDQGFLGIVGAMLSGISIANQLLL